MPIDLSESLERALKKKCPPTVLVYNRIDGPGSSLDLREFQQALWKLLAIPKDVDADPSLPWTRELPRTIGITLDIGTKIEAHPLQSNSIGIRSKEYNIKMIRTPGQILPTKRNWLLKIIEIFGIRGVLFDIQNLQKGTISSGLGGSASVATGVCLLANELAGRPFNGTQLISMASRIEQDLHVSITGTQEQSNVLYGGVTDYVWFPWGIPGKPDSGYGDSLRYQLIPEDDYYQLEGRMAIFHTGIEHLSSIVNSAWRRKLYNHKGYNLHSKKLEIAYQFREGLRLRKWDKVLESVQDYRKIRTELCKEYMSGAWGILKQAEARGSTAFPLGAGGGGAVLVISAEPDDLQKLKKDLNNAYQQIPFRIKSAGHEFYNMKVR